jgi:predicted dehydrogenase
LGSREHGGGPLLYIGTHVIYQVLDVVQAKPERVYAEVDVTPNGVDAWCLFTVRFEGGIVAQISTSQAMGGRYGWIDIVGSEGRLRSEWESSSVVVQSRKVPEYRDLTRIEVDPAATGPATGPGTRASVSGFKYVRAWAAEFVEFVAAIQEDRAPRVSGADGVTVLEIADAVIESGRTGKAVTL